MPCWNGVLWYRVVRYSVVSLLACTRHQGVKHTKLHAAHCRIDKCDNVALQIEGVQTSCEMHDIAYK